MTAKVNDPSILLGYMITNTGFSVDRNSPTGNPIPVVMLQSANKPTRILELIDAKVYDDGDIDVEHISGNN